MSFWRPFEDKSGSVSATQMLCMDSQFAAFRTSDSHRLCDAKCIEDPAGVNDTHFDTIEQLLHSDVNHRARADGATGSPRMESKLLERVNEKKSTSNSCKGKELTIDCEETQKHKCGQCSFSTAFSSNLKKHIRIHTGEKPFECEHCERSFRDSSNLLRHVRTHREVKPFKCQYCDHSAARKDNLIEHVMNNHTKKRPFKCVYKHCGYSATIASNLKKHIRIHTGEKPFKCEHCHYSTTTSWNLKVHVRSQH